MHEIVLSPKENKRWQAAVQRSTGDLRDAQSNEIYVSPGETRSLPEQATALGMKQVQVDSIEDLNKIFGVPNTIFKNPPTSDITPPVADVLSRSAAGTTIHSDDGDLAKAVDTILFNDSAGFEAAAKVINKVSFPVMLNVVAAIKATLADNATLVVDGAPENAPQGLYLFVLGSLSLGAGAQVQISERVVIDVQVAQSVDNAVKAQNAP